MKFLKKWGRHREAQFAHSFYLKGHKVHKKSKFKTKIQPIKVSKKILMSLLQMPSKFPSCFLSG